MIDKFPKYYFSKPNFSSHDITGFFDNFIDDFFTLISSMFDLLDCIQIYGVGLLNILVTFFIVGIIIPIILSIVNARSVNSRVEKRIAKKRLERNVYHADENNTFIKY